MQADADQSAHLRIVKSAVFVRIVERKVWCLVLPTIFNQNHTFKTLRGWGWRSCFHTITLYMYMAFRNPLFDSRPTELVYFLLFEI